MDAMNTTEDKYTQWVELLKNTSPVLDNPEELTNEIINKVKLLPVTAKKNKLLYVSGWMVRVAALFLFCFWMGESFYSSSENTSAGLPLASALNRSTAFLPFDRDLSLEEKNKLIQTALAGIQERRMIAEEYLMEYKSTK